MSEKQNDTNSLGLTRAGTAVLICALLGGAVWWSVSTSATREQNDRRRAVEAAYIEANGCVIAQMDGRFVSKYRCDTPATRYLSAAELAREARDGATKN